MADKKVASCRYEPGTLDDVMEFLKRTRNELRELKKVHVWPDRLRILDVNEDYFEVDGLGYAAEDITHVLKSIGTNFKPEFIHDPIKRPFKEFKTGRRHPWAEDRVM